MCILYLYIITTAVAEATIMRLFKLNESCLHIYSEAKLIKVSHYYFVVDYSLIWILKTCTRTAAHLSLGLGRRYFCNINMET